MTIDEDFESPGLENDSNWGSNKVFQNYLMPTLKLYDTRVSINHWQLRDCVKHSSREPGKIYYIYDHSIRVLDTRANHSGTKLDAKKVGLRDRKRRSSSPKRHVKSQLRSPSQKLVEFDFKSRCFQERGGLLASGGLMGPDDNGNWAQFSRQSSSTADNSASDSSNSKIEPIKIANGAVLSDHNPYSNPESWKGVLSVYNEENDTSLTYRLGQYINNCVLLHPKSTQQFDLFACNNDAHLYQCDISNRGVELTRRYSDLKFSLNNATLSHDGKTLITSGDSSKFAIYHQNEITGFFSLKYDTQPQWGSSFIRNKRIPRYAMPDRSGFIDNIYEVPGGDHGFYTSFSENDLLFASVFQNGTCWVYDARKMETPLAEINSTRKYTQNGAFRVCKFSEGMDDLLFISEHHGRVHVVDTRNFMNHQVIMIPDRNSSSGDDKQPPATARRSSMPAQLNDPHTTFAASIPVSELQPQLIPYPKVINCMNNNLDASRPDEESAETVVTGRRERRRSSFRVRRFSTSNNSPVLSLESIDPSILDSRYNAQNYRAVDNYNYVGESRRGSEFSLHRQNHLPHHTDSESLFVNDVEVVEAYSDVNDELSHTIVPGSRSQARRTSPSVLQYTRGSDLSTNGTDENSISGIDWMDDEEGSSLVIGTDYGIMKWNINSWARRSFPSYDFC
ncbi:LANO_0H05622g1_1 [Lachancea nothofagi CBS 11611]|uniref:LANO_0H05622g1_1 n=1 Tax=Lachancea nothofagi CBS 11611 TaxID=1266666 RepID=A0A1G4KLJ4_9SACH|nr:LANO_0H05622g1_1 [Lachancea nothofagi CBS 11611]